eukprot:XP_011669927.1 PREDICTED: protein Hook homolog 1-like [Strongylocentrotus purpuratus]
MASSNADLKTRIATLRHEILSYTPGKAVPCDDERVVFPDKLVVGRVPHCAIFRYGDFPKGRNELKQLGITDMYEVTDSGGTQSYKDKLQLLDLLRGCLYEGDRTLAANDLEKMCKNPRCTLSYEKTKKEVKEAKEANQKMFTEVQEQNQELKKGREEDRERSEKEKRSLAAEMTKKLECKQQHVDTLTETVREKERNETTLRQQVEELKKGREEDRARSKKEQRLLAADMTKKLESKQQHVDTLTETVREKERNETTLTQQVEELKKGREEDGARSEKERRSLEGDMTKKLESKQHHVDTLTETVGEKERNETTLTQVEGREEDRARSEKEKRSLAADMTKKLESQLQHVDTLTEIVGEKERLVPLCALRSDEDIRKARNGLEQLGITDMYEIPEPGGSLSDDDQLQWLDLLRGCLYKGDRTLAANDLKKMCTNPRCVAEEQIDDEYANEDVNDHQLSYRDETSLEQDRTKGHIGIQVLQEATSSSNHSPQDGHTGDMASKTQEDLTDGSRSQHLDQSPERSTEDLDESEVTSEEVSSEEVHPGDDMNNVPNLRSPLHKIQGRPALYTNELLTPCKHGECGRDVPPWRNR